MTNIQTRLLAAAAMLIVLWLCPTGYAADHRQAEPNGNSSALRDRMNREHAPLQDLTATVVIESRDDRVLERIGERRLSQYQVKRAQLRLKAPDCTRIEAAAHGMRVISITNHERSVIRIKPIGYEKAKALNDRTEERPFALLLGLATPQIWDEFAVNDIEAESQSSSECCKLELLSLRDRRRLFCIAIDMKTLAIRECSIYNSTGDTPKMVCRYLEPIQVSGVWVPTRIELLSAEGEPAASLKLNDVAINTGLDNGLFR